MRTEERRGGIYKRHAALAFVHNQSHDFGLLAAQICAVSIAPLCVWVSVFTDKRGRLERYGRSLEWICAFCTNKKTAKRVGMKCKHEVRVASTALRQWSHEKVNEALHTNEIKKRKKFLVYSSAHLLSYHTIYLSNGVIFHIKVKSGLLRTIKWLCRYFKSGISTWSLTCSQAVSTLGTLSFSQEGVLPILLDTESGSNRFQRRLCGVLCDWSKGCGCGCV